MTRGGKDVAATNLEGVCWHVTHVRRTGLATYPPGAHLGPRTIPDLEFAWIIAGDASIRYGEETWVARPGDLMLLLPGMVHEFLWSRHRPTRHGYIHFSLAGPLPPGGMRAAVLKAPEASPLCVLLGYLLTLARRAGAAQGQAAELLYLGLSFVLRAFTIESDRQCTAREPGGSRHPAIERAVGHLSSQRQGGVIPRMTAARLAHRVGLSEAHLNRLVKAHFGHTLSAVLRHRRLNHALELLDLTDLAVKEVAAAAGYENRFAFSRAVKHAFGAAPAELRAALRAGAPRPPHLPELE